MGRPSTLSLSQPHSHSNGSIQSLGTTSIRKPERSRTTPSSHYSAPRPAPSIPTRHASSSATHDTHPYYNTYKQPKQSQSYTHAPPQNPPRIHQRPGLVNRQNSVQTRYMDMLLSLDTIPRLHNIYASFFTWILLAGYIIFPGTFTSIQKLDDNSTIQSSETATFILHSFKHISLLVIAGICCAIGALGMIWLWWTWAENYVWLLNRIFLPGCLNSFAGLISTLINVYSQQGGAWSVTARVTAAVSGGAMVITGALFVVYNFWLLQRVKSRHSKEVREGEGLFEKVGRKAHEPALEPGSVV